jgi:hypothetical protein
MSFDFIMAQLSHTLNEAGFVQPARFEKIDGRGKEYGKFVVEPTECPYSLAVTYYINDPVIAGDIEYRNAWSVRVKFTTLDNLHDFLIQLAP